MGRGGRGSYSGNGYAQAMAAARRQEEHDRLAAERADRKQRSQSVQRERNVGVDEEHSRTEKGQQNWGGDSGRR